jgi:hypothetical protein
MPEVLILAFTGISDPSAVRRAPPLAHHLPDA